MEESTARRGFKTLTRKVQTPDNTLQLVFPTVNRLGQKVADGKIDGLLIQVVLEYDESGIEQRDVGVEDIIEFG